MTPGPRSAGAATAHRPRLRRCASMGGAATSYPAPMDRPPAPGPPLPGLKTSGGRDDGGSSPPAGNVVWQRGAVSRERRRERLGQRGGTLWLTGLPGAGKTTIAMALEQRLAEAGWLAYVLDGDNLRHGLNADLGFDAAGRAENVRRTAEVARLIADTGTICIVSLISPYADDRARARAIHERARLDFLEIFVDTPPAECERRDPKGLWARARRGEIARFTGVDSPYEPPTDPQLTLRTVDLPLEDELERLIELLTARDLVRRGGPDPRRIPSTP